MSLSKQNLQSLLEENVCEIVFKRRRPIENHSEYRRMLCTNCVDLLMSPNGRVCLNFRPTTRKLHFNIDNKNLIVTWDVLMQDYRLISMDNCTLTNTIKKDEFWEYFNNVLMKLTAKQKLDFMNNISTHL